MSPRPSSKLTLEHVLLALLDTRPMHGYELYQELRALPGIALVWNIKQPMLYALLDKLETRGFLTSHFIPGDSYPPRKEFQLTASGKTSLQAWISAPVHRARDLRQEFLAKLIIARRYGKETALDLIRAQRRLCQTWSDELSSKEISPTLPSIDEWVVHSFRVNRVEAVLKWLDTCEKEIDRLPLQPAV